MSNFTQGFCFGLTTSMLGGYSGFGFGGFGLGGFGFGGFGFGGGSNPIFSCYADLDSRSGVSSWIPAINYPLQEGYTFPVTASNPFSIWC